MKVVRGSGFRLTSARRTVPEALLAAHTPTSAEEIADTLGGRLTQSDLASVYRDLETLGEIGLVRHFHACTSDRCRTAARRPAPPRGI